MSHSEQGLNPARRHQVEAIVARHIRTLFRRLPMLSGFWLRFDLDAEISFFTWPACSVDRHLYEEVMHALVDLAEECPEAVHLIRGRTFARAVH